MKIALISSGYPTPEYQFFTFVQQLVEQMIDIGVEVSVIVPQSIVHNIIHRKSMLPYKNLYRTKGGKEYWVYRPKFLSFGNRGGLLGMIATHTKENAIFSVLKHIEYEVVYSHFWENSLEIYPFCAKNNIPLFVACGEGDNALEMMVENMSTSKKQSLRKAVTGVISVSSENKRKCLQYGLSEQNNTIVLPNCVNTNIFKPSSNSIFKKKYNISDDDFVISFVGAFINRKGSKRVSDAIKKLNDKSIKSIFIGKPFENENEEPTCDGVIFKGEVLHDDIAEFLNASDVFVLPTLKEGCCNAIVEALACGLPIVSSNGPFNDDILNEENSIRVNPNNVDEIADAIYTLKNNKVLYNEKKKYTLAHSSDYSLAIRAKKIIDFINCNIKL